MKIELRPIETITPYEQNPRINDAAVDAVAASLKEFGFRQPIVVDAESVIVVGHTRYKGALKLRLSHVPVHVATDLTPAQAKAYRIADNQTASIAEWDKVLLPLELAGLQEMNFDLSLLGFGEADLAELMGTTGNAGLVDPDEVPEPPEEPVTKPGDAWHLGDHRLMCGDATSPTDVARLMDSTVARMCFTDPPWNVAIGSDANPRHRQRPGLKNDDLSAADFRAMLDGFAQALRPHLAGDLYCVLGASEWPTLDLALRGAGYHWSATVIWVKDQFVLGRSKYHRRYEPIWYGWHEQGKSSFGDRRDLDDVWEIPRPKRSELHPTCKPVELVARAIANSSVPGDAVIDCFGGSGTTLIAAEQTGRTAHLMELGPLYCDVIVSRWEQFSGKTAERQAAPAVA
jgi:site-specific DNA-methyltransferase (adenine-specific)